MKRTITKSKYAKSRSTGGATPWAVIVFLVVTLAVLFSAPIPAQQSPAEEGNGSTQEQESGEEAPPAPEENGEEQEPPAESEKPEGEKASPDGLKLNFKDSTVDAILEYLSEAAGLTIIKDVTVDGRISVISRQKVSVPEAISLLNSVLKEKGYAAVRMERTLKIVPLEQAKQENIPVRTGSDPEGIELTDELITQIIPVKYADATKLQENLQSLIPSYAELSANASSNALILTDTSANIRRIAEIIQGLDTHMSAVTSVRVVRLNYASATEAANLVNQIFTGAEAQGQRRDSPRDRIRRFFRGPGGPGGDDREDQNGGTPSQKVTASADTRTNSVVVTGPAEVLDVVEDVLHELDSSPAAEFAEIKVFQLEYASATDAANLINEIFGGEESQQPARGGRGDRFRRFMRGGDDSSDENGGAMEEATASADDRTNTLVVTAAPDTLRVVEKLVQDLDANPSEEEAVFVYRLKNADAANLEQILNDLFMSSTTGTTRSGARGRQTGRFQQSRFGSTNTIQTSNELAGQVYFVADEDTNSLLVMAASKHFDRIKEILNDLDEPVPEVLIKVLLAEVTHDDSIDLGVEFSALNLDASGKGQELFTDFNVTEQTSGMVAKVVEEDVNVALRALSEVGKLDVLSRPYILASDNQEATISVGQEVPFINQSRTTETGQTINTVTYEDIGIILNVTPHINPDGLVILDVSPEISELTGTTVQVSETTSLPVYAKRTATSRVGILDGQTIVIGGLVQDNKTETIRKVPVLGDIPLLGWFFRRTQDKVSKTELLIFLTPHVALKPEHLEAMSEDEQKSHKVVPQAVEPGKFEEYMEGMKRGSSKNAREAEENGKKTVPEGGNSGDSAGGAGDSGMPD